MKDYTYMRKINSSLENLNKAYAISQSRIDRQLNGVLRISKRPGGNPRFYYTSIVEGKRIDKSIKKDDPLIGRLVQNSYYKKISKALNDEIKSIQCFQERYHPERKYELYENLSNERKKYITPLFASDLVSVEEWEKEEWVRYNGYPENLRYDTNAGHKVRSKSERTIANLLYQHRDVLVYRYEQEIYLKTAGVYVHPDFTIRNRITGRIFYWEHAGMLDKIEYVTDFVRKMNAFTLEGMFPAENFFITFETAGIPDSTRIENQFLQVLLKG